MTRGHTQTDMDTDTDTIDGGGMLGYSYADVIKPYNTPVKGAAVQNEYNEVLKATGGKDDDPTAAASHKDVYADNIIMDLAALTLIMHMLACSSDPEGAAGKKIYAEIMDVCTKPINTELNKGVFFTKLAVKEPKFFVDPKTGDVMLGGQMPQQAEEKKGFFKSVVSKMSGNGPPNSFRLAQADVIGHIKKTLLAPAAPAEAKKVEGEGATSPEPGGEGEAGEHPEGDEGEGEKPSGEGETDPTKVPEAGEGEADEHPEGEGEHTESAKGETDPPKVPEAGEGPGEGETPGGERPEGDHPEEKSAKGGGMFSSKEMYIDVIAAALKMNMAIYDKRPFRGGYEALVADVVDRRDAKKQKVQYLPTNETVTVTDRVAAAVFYLFHAWLLRTTDAANGASVNLQDHCARMQPVFEAFASANKLCAVFSEVVLVRHIDTDSGDPPTFSTKQKVNKKVGNELKKIDANIFLPHQAIPIADVKAAAEAWLASNAVGKTDGNAADADGEAAALPQPANVAGEEKNTTANVAGQGGQTVETGTVPQPGGQEVKEEAANNAGPKQGMIGKIGGLFHRK